MESRFLACARDDKLMDPEYRPYLNMRISMIILLITIFALPAVMILGALSIGKCTEIQYQAKKQYPEIAKVIQDKYNKRAQIVLLLYFIGFLLNVPKTHSHVVYCFILKLLSSVISIITPFMYLWFYKLKINDLKGILGKPID